MPIRWGLPPHRRLTRSTRRHCGGFWPPCREEQRCHRCRPCRRRSRRRWPPACHHAQSWRFVRQPRPAPPPRSLTQRSSRRYFHVRPLQPMVVLPAASARLRVRPQMPRRTQGGTVQPPTAHRPSDSPTSWRVRPRSFLLAPMSGIRQRAPLRPKTNTRHCERICSICRPRTRHVVSSFARSTGSASNHPEYSRSISCNSVPWKLSWSHIPMSVATVIASAHVCAPPGSALCSWRRLKMPKQFWRWEARARSRTR
mmetsp:Transcript_19534/g.39439  ORF Transcript_19534/g.39439 Transcript_19534/m.39439 type:complete len:255 (+) Transcript_19534:858-1622(+)